jgi:hypothetical protein
METKFKIIETKDYILAVSDDEIKEGDLCFLEENYYVNGGVGKYNHQKASGWGIAYSPHGHNFFKKIISYQPKNNAPELDLPLLPLLPEIVVEDDVEKLAKETTKKYVNEREKQTAYLEFIKGYKAATKVYSEEDLRKAIKMAVKGMLDSGVKGWTTVTENEIIQSINQPKTHEWFVAEMEYQNLDGKWSSYYPFASSAKDSRLKTTTISGKTYLVGHYE